MPDDNLNNAADKELVKAIRNSNQAAYEVFFRRHFESIHYLIWQLIHNDEAANDLCQNTFIKIWEIRKSLDPEKSAKAFLQVIARNQALSWLRMPRNRHLSLEEHDFPVEGAEEENEELTQKLHTAIKDIEEPLRVIINMRLRGFKDKEIADLLSVSIATVDKRKTKAFNIIRQRLQPFLDT